MPIRVKNDSEFNAEIVAQARYEGKQWIHSVLERAGKARWKVDIHVRGTDWENSSVLNKPTIGNLFPITSNSADWTKKNLRLHQANHELNRNGWIVTMRFEEDIEDAVPGQE